MVLPGTSACGSHPHLSRSCLVSYSAYRAGETLRARFSPVEAMEPDGEILFRAGIGDRERGFPAGVRAPIESDAEPAKRALDYCFCFRAVPFLWLLPGGGLPRNAAIGARAPLGRARRDTRRQSSLYLWPASLESLYPHERPDVRLHLCHRPLFR